VTRPRFVNVRRDEWEKFKDKFCKANNGIVKKNVFLARIPWSELSQFRLVAKFRKRLDNVNV